ncbi:homeodomain-only protein isoform X1 [Passer montanus]|uniref:homeodomain-only protein isoform X1 n=1 Tax=Passer montanus TaxID=9160 RepID=UPI0019600194|nr:homeodomain-only protein isoform X1 [Passer montanus]
MSPAGRAGWPQLGCTGAVSCTPPAPFLHPAGSSPGRDRVLGPRGGGTGLAGHREPAEPEPRAEGALPKGAGAKPELPARRVAVDPASSCDLRQVFQVPACQTHTQILKQSPEDLRGSCFTHFWSPPAPVPGPIALPQEEMAMEKPVIPTEEQLEILEYHFCKVNKHPDPTTLCLIAAETGLSEEQTLKWFKQRLAEWRKSEGLPSESGSVRD